MNDSLDDIIRDTPDPMNDTPPSIQYVRLKTDIWHNSRGLFRRQSILFLKRHSSGWQPLKEDSDDFGSDVVGERIVNLHECEDGLYTVSTCNVKGQGTEDVEYDYQLDPVPIYGPSLALFRAYEGSAKWTQRLADLREQGRASREAASVKLSTPDLRPKLNP